MKITPYHAKYFAHELAKRSASNSIEKLAASLSDAQVDLNPHQIEAALFAFRSPFSRGAILADEVGLGKTIEAGILLSQKWAERKRRLLIIAPSSLRKQWNQELLDKFFLPSVILETKSFNDEVRKGNLNPFDQKEIIICSYHFAKTKEACIREIGWDLAVLDEAHHLRNVYKPTNRIAVTIKSALLHAPKLLLTATPLQNSLLELYGLVSVIDEYTFGDLKSFKAQFSRLTQKDFYDLKQRLKPICQRTLRRQVLEYIKYTNRISITQEFYPTENEERLYDLVSEYLKRPNLYALPPGQRQLMTLILRKLLASSTYAISGTLEALSHRLDAILQKQMQTILPLEDAIAADFEGYDEEKDEWESETNDAAPQYSPDDLKNISQEIASLKDFRYLASSIKKNSKGEALLTALDKGFALAAEKGASRKAIIFTESTRTQEYLKNVLENSGYEGKLVLFNGSNSSAESRQIYLQWIHRYEGTDRVTGSRTADTRAALVEHFMNDAEIMIATEAGAEGINLQFCSLVVNYDLPWNPQRIEQRIGRCHRYGQKHDVVVVNFLNKKNAADQRVYQLLSEKFKLFEGVFGASDDVLGAIESGVDFERRIAQIYQECRTEEEIQDAFDLLQKDMEMQIDETINITRQKLLENFDEEVHEKLRVNVRESKEYLSRYESWLWDLTRYYLAPYADFASDDHSFTLRRNPFSEETIHPGPYRLGKYVEDANTYRVGHPLARRIIDACSSLDLPVQELIFNYSDTPKKISVLEECRGRAGWLALYNLTITALDTEDHILFSGIYDNGEVLDVEQCRRLFSLPAAMNAAASPMQQDLAELIEKITHASETEILSMNAHRNSSFFDDEMEKLDKWAEDVKSSIEIELKELDKDIKTKKTEAKKILNLEEKVKAQREIKEMEKKRNVLRQNLYQAQDDVDVKKDRLIDEIEIRLRQKIDRTRLFLAKWRAE